MSSLDCIRCDRSYLSLPAKEQHVRDSPNHHICYECPSKPDCATQQSLKRHMDKVHGAQRQYDAHTPLDVFFRSFPSFNYSSRLPPSASWKLLWDHHGWDDEDNAARNARSRYMKALVSEAHLLFGKKSDIEACQMLCQAVGVKDLPDTLTQCGKLLQKTHVNLVDLISWARTDGRNGTVRTFKNMYKLREYTQAHDKFFPIKKTRKDGENLAIRYLLRSMY